MRNQGIEGRAALGLVEAGDGIGIGGVGAEPVDGFGRKRDQTAFRERAGGSRQLGRAGGRNLGGQASGHGLKISKIGSLRCAKADAISRGLSRSVAQPGRALRSGRRGRRFESCHSDQNFIRFFVLIGGCSRVNHRFNHRNVSTFLANSGCCPLQKVGVMVAVRFLQNLRRHPQEPCSLPDRHAPLHQPRRGRVAKGMGGDLARQPGQPYGALEACFYRRYRLAIELDEAGRDQPARSPATHVGEQARREGGRGLALLGGSSADRLPIEDAPVQVDERPARFAIGRCGCDRASPGAGVKADQNEPCNMF